MSLYMDAGAYPPDPTVSTVDGRSLRRLLDDHLSTTAVDELINVRRVLHKHPEIAGNEYNTTELICTMLADAGLNPQVMPNGTGVICDIPGNEEGEWITLRADIDALPMQDRKLVWYRSEVDGVAHACGHDVHTTTLLGAALILAKLAKSGQLRRGVRLIFQPAEETGQGAKQVIAAGGMENVERVFALHCDPSLKTGQIGLLEGALTASVDFLRLEVKGRGGHPGRRHLTDDLVQVLCEMLIALPKALHQQIDVQTSPVLVFGEMAAGTKANVIGEYGYAAGTLRCPLSTTRADALRVLDTTVDKLADLYGVTAKLHHEEGVPPTVNERHSVEFFRKAADLVGIKSVATKKSMGGEDFGHLVQAASLGGAMARLGVRDPDAKEWSDLHRPPFDVHEPCIRHGVEAFVAAALLASGATQTRVLPPVGNHPAQPLNELQPRARLTPGPAHLEPYEKSRQDGCRSAWSPIQVSRVGRITPSGQVSTLAAGGSRDPRCDSGSARSSRACHSTRSTEWTCSGHFGRTKYLATY